MKPMFALIAVGIILLLIMLYYGKSSFDGVYTTGVYDNREKFNNTIDDIKLFEKNILEVKLSYDNTTNISSLTYKVNEEYEGKYTLNKISLTTPIKMNNLDFKMDNDTNKYSFIGKLNPGLYKVIYNIDYNNKNFEVQKSVYVD